MDTEIEVRKMECKEIRVDVRTASIKESTEGQRQTKILFQINHTMPFTDEYNHLLKELFGNNLGDGSMISPPLNGACVGSCLLYTSPSPRDMRRSRMPSSA